MRSNVQKVLKMGYKEGIFLHIENAYEWQCMIHESHHESHRQSKRAIEEECEFSICVNWHQKYPNSLMHSCGRFLYAKICVRNIPISWCIVRTFSIYENLCQKYPNKSESAVQNFYMEKLTCLYIQKFGASFYIEKFG